MLRILTQHAALGFGQFGPTANGARRIVLGRHIGPQPIGRRTRAAPDSFGNGFGPRGPLLFIHLLLNDLQGRLLGQQLVLLEAHDPAQRRQTVIGREFGQLLNDLQMLAVLARFVTGVLIGLHQPLDLGRVGFDHPLHAHQADQIAGSVGNLQIVSVFGLVQCVEGFDPDLGELLLGSLANEIVVIAQLIDQLSNLVPADRAGEFGRLKRRAGGTPNAQPNCRPNARSHPSRHNHSEPRLTFLRRATTAPHSSIAERAQSGQVFRPPGMISPRTGGIRGLLSNAYAAQTRAGLPPRHHGHDVRIEKRVPEATALNENRRRQTAITRSPSRFILFFVSALPSAVLSWCPWCRGGTPSFSSWLIFVLNAAADGLCFGRLGGSAGQQCVEGLAQVGLLRLVRGLPVVVDRPLIGDMPLRGRRQRPRE